MSPYLVPVVETKDLDERQHKKLLFICILRSLTISNEFCSFSNHNLKCTQLYISMLLYILVTFSCRHSYKQMKRFILARSTPNKLWRENTDIALLYGYVTDLICKNHAVVGTERMRRQAKYYKVVIITSKINLTKGKKREVVRITLFLF